MPVTTSKLKCRVATNLYYKTMVDMYGISSCSQDYPPAEFLDDMLQITLRDNGRDCGVLKAGHIRTLENDRRSHQPIIVNYGTCVPLPISSCNTCTGNNSPC